MARLINENFLNQMLSHGLRKHSSVAFWLASSAYGQKIPASSEHCLAKSINQKTLNTVIRNGPDELYSVAICLEKKLSWASIIIDN